MNEKEKILAWQAENPVPNPELVPDVVICYQTSKKGTKTIKYYHAITGKVYSDIDPERPGDFKQDPNRYFECRAASPSYPRRTTIYIEYDVAREMLVIKRMRFKFDKPDKNLNRDKRTWEWINWTEEHIPTNFACEYYLFKGSSKVYTYNGELYYPDKQGKYYNKEFLKTFYDLLKFNTTMNRAKMELRTFFDIAQPADDPTGADYYGNYAIDSYWSMQDRYRLMEPRTASKSENRLEELLKIDLKPLTDYEAKCPVDAIKYRKYTGSYETTDILSRWWIYEKIDDKTSVLRHVIKNTASRSMISSMKSEEVLRLPDSPFDGEDGRIYFDNGNIICAYKKRVSDKFEKTRIDLIEQCNSWYYTCSRLMNPEDMLKLDMFKGNEKEVENIRQISIRSKCGDDFLAKITNAYMISEIISTINNPVLMMLSEEGISTKNHFSGIPEMSKLSDLVGHKITSKKQDYKKMFNMNKYQITKIMEDKYWKNSGSDMLQLLFGDKLPDFTNEETDKYFDTAKKLGSYNYWQRYLSSDRYGLMTKWGISYLSEIEEDNKQEMIRNFNFCLEHGEEAIKLLHDIGEKLGKSYDKILIGKIKLCLSEVKTYDDLKLAADKISLM